MKTNIALLIEQAANVIDSLNTGIRLTQDEQMFICEHFIREKVKKNDFTIKSGDYENYIYFIEAGFLGTSRKAGAFVKMVRSEC